MRGPSRHQRCRRPAALVVTIAGVATLLAACAGGDFVAPKALHAAPEPAVSPPVTTRPAGATVAVGPGPEGIVATASGTIVVAVRGARPGLDVVDGSARRVESFVPLPGEARHLELAGPDGPVLVPIETADRLDEVSVPGGRVLASYPTGRQPHDATALGSELVSGDEFGNTAHIVRPGQPAVVVAAPLQPGGVASDGSAFVVVGVRARVIEAYRPDGSVIGRAAAGAGPSHVVAGTGGYFYVADTLGGALLVYRLQGSSFRQVGRIPVGSRPYGLASDPTTGWVYVTLTGSNQLLGLRMDGAKVEEGTTWSTGRQPNSVAVDDHDDQLAVTVTDSDQVELIPAPLG